MKKMFSSSRIYVIIVAMFFSSLFLYSQKVYAAACAENEFIELASCECQPPLAPIQDSSNRWVCSSRTPSDPADTSAGIDFDSTTGVTNETLDSLNPLNNLSSSASAELSTPAGIINRALTFLFPIAGIILFIMWIWGGFEMLVGAAGKKSLDAGRQRLTAATIGFFLLFVSYWIMQIVEIVLGVNIL